MKYHMTTEEIAQELGVSEDTVKGILVRALAKIRLRHPQLRYWL
jgi:DNA-binding CsgD family transcriptional regulator